MKLDQVAGCEDLLVRFADCSKVLFCLVHVLLAVTPGALWQCSNDRAPCRTRPHTVKHIHYRPCNSNTQSRSTEGRGNEAQALALDSGCCFAGPSASMTWHAAVQCLLLPPNMQDKAKHTKLRRLITTSFCSGLCGAAVTK